MKKSIIPNVVHCFRSGRNVTIDAVAVQGQTVAVKSRAIVKRDSDWNLFIRSPESDLEVELANSILYCEGSRAYISKCRRGYYLNTPCDDMPTKARRLSDSWTHAHA